MRYTVITGNANHVSASALHGWSMRATTAAVVNLRKASGSGDIVASVNIPLNETSNASFDRPLYIDGGVYVEVVSGAIVGSLWHS